MHKERHTMNLYINKSMDKIKKQLHYMVIFDTLRNNDILDGSSEPHTWNKSKFNRVIFSFFDFL